MRAISLALLITLVGGCASARVGRDVGAELTLSAQHINPTCLPTAEKNEVLLRITNSGANAVAFPLADEGKTAPYWLYGHNIRILTAKAGSTDYKWYDVSLSEYAASRKDLILHRGDTAEITSLFPAWSPEDATNSFEIEVRDRSGRIFVSTPFQLCGMS